MHEVKRNPNQSPDPNYGIIEFSQNWNNKLNSTSFTTLRLSNISKYKVGKCFNVFLKSSKPDDFLFHVKIVDVKTVYYSSINNYISHLDSGYPPETLKNILFKMYSQKTSINADTMFSFVLFTKVINTQTAQK